MTEFEQKGTIIEKRSSILEREIAEFRRKISLLESTLKNKDDETIQLKQKVEQLFCLLENKGVKKDSYNSHILYSQDQGSLKRNQSRRK